MISTTPTQSYTAHPLQERLLSLPFDAFAALVALLLPSFGYEDIHLAGRRDFKGRNGRDGASGYDLVATRDGRPVLIQLKQFQQKNLLFQRSLDELRGVALRRGASQALLVTTSDFSPSVNRTAHRQSPIAPIVTMSGEELAQKLVESGIGVTQDGEIDEALLDRLSKAALGNGPEDCAGSNGIDLPSLLVTVQVQRLARSPRTQRRGLR